MSSTERTSIVAFCETGCLKMSLSSKTVKSSKKRLWSRKWKKLKRLLEKYWGISLERDLLSRLRWQKTEKGYELIFLPSAYRDYPSRPRKIVDLVRWRASLGHALARLLVKEVTIQIAGVIPQVGPCLLYTSPSPRDLSTARMPSSA